MDWDGCPDTPSTGSTISTRADSDFDGIPDYIDQCPTQREIINKFQDDDGCPDTIVYDSFGDPDADGIFGSNDLCPYLKETYNKFQDMTVALIHFQLTNHLQTLTVTEF
ncbi:hypothetical protein BG20_I0333 [Candidatus Nitrosarchaeum limnium BG20]|uniref:Thrombospondin type 3 repeat protein n=1 Tax=Candidatus Nitrosarchaeum limnium BG20 TaxID=859192 RepID=S2DZG7_9ARCH|nr:hypothetical protein BG20_I0333 [Candidatus Nitrosarchaeum limnium BG20]